MKKLEFLSVDEKGKRYVDWNSLEALTNKEFVIFIQNELFKLDSDFQIIEFNVYDDDFTLGDFVKVEVIHSYDVEPELFDEFKFYRCDNSYEHTLGLTKLKILYLARKMSV